MEIAQEDNYMYFNNRSCDYNIYQTCLSDLEEGYLSGETLCDSRSESDFSEIETVDIASDSALFDAYCSLDNIFGIKDPEIKFESDVKNPEICPSSPFDTNNFPTSVSDISTMIVDLDVIKFEFPNSLSFNQPDTLLTNISNNHITTGPMVKIEVSHEDWVEQKETISINTNNLLPPKRKKHQNRKYSSTDSESDEEWAPDDVSCRHGQIKANAQRKRKISISKRNPRPIPQRRAPGTKQKITQWIVSLLRDPRYNPKVITWVNEERGIFQVKNTDNFGKLWGVVRKNANMNYEKLSRAMRYSYTNNELQMVPEQRLTYKFGPNMVDCRALDRKNPNFQKMPKKH